MLRYVIGDSLFFEVLHSYAADPGIKYKNAATADFIGKVNEVTGNDYSWFFNEWIYGPNQPKYQNVYEISGGDTSWTTHFTISQVQTNAGFFRMPVDLLINFSDGSDTVISVMNDSNDQEYYFESERQPSGVVFDPDNNIVLKTGTTTGISEKKEDLHPGEFRLEQNYPNPFNPSTRIRWQTAESGWQTLKVYNILGKEVAVPVNEYRPAGSYEIEFPAHSANGINLPSGVYFYQLKTGTHMSVKKMIVLK